jgi:hypothetical protein
VSASAGVDPRLDGSGNLGYQGGPWTLHGSYSCNHTERTLVQDLLRHQPATDAPPFLDQTTTRQQAYGGHSFNAEIEYAFTPQTTLSLTSTGSVRGSDQTHTTTAHRSDAPTSTREVERSHQSFNPDERLSVSHQFDAEDHELSADLRYEGEESDTRVREEQVSTSPRERMHILEDRLDPSNFTRIHRSTIARLDLIGAVCRRSGGDYTARLETGEELDVSRSWHEDLLVQLETGLS